MKKYFGIVIGPIVGASDFPSIKKEAANAAAATSKKVTPDGNQGCSVNKLSRRSLSYFNSEAFEKWLKRYEDEVKAKAYGKLIGKRKHARDEERAFEIAEAMMYVDIFDAHYDGFRYSWTEAKSILSGYKGQALASLKTIKGSFERTILKKFIKLCENKATLKDFLDYLNRPQINNEVCF